LWFCNDHIHKLALTLTALTTIQQGLGKTIEAIAGAILRNELAAAKGAKKRPTVIVSPNDAVLMQWRDALILNGVSIDRIVMFKKAQTDGFADTNFVLLTRYTIQAEVRELFDYLDLNSPPRKTSALFPNVTKQGLRKLKNQYE
jgi:hypothetical protein